MADSAVPETRTTESPFARMRRLSPRVTGGIMRMREESYRDGAVPGKYKILTALAISVAIRCEPCIKAYAQMAKDRGVTEEELVEFLNVAMTMQGCPGEEWAIKALVAFEGEPEETSGNGAASGESCCST